MECVDSLKLENEELKCKIFLLERENEELKKNLKKYTAPSRSKKYYEVHKDELLAKMKENPISSDKRKEYNKNYYLKKKALIKDNNDV